jgi:hypothetical protein
MKHLLIFIPIVFVFFINSCSLAEAPPTISSAQWDAVRQTETAGAWTAIPTGTFNPNISNMITWLNGDLVSSANALGLTMDARYSVTNIKFENHSPMTFRINVNCICMNNADCCIPARTFVVILDALKRNSSSTLAMIPAETSQMMVVCYDKANTQIGAIAASWPTVQGYLQGYVSGYELGVQVTLTGAP